MDSLSDGQLTLGYRISQENSACHVHYVVSLNLALKYSLSVLTQLII